MLEIPYVGAPKNACALACYTMVAKYFFPGTTFKQIAKASDWEPGYIVWAFKFWKWILDRGIRVTDYDLVSLQAWANEGMEGLQKSVSKKEFEFYKKGTKDLEAFSDDIRKIMKHKNFRYKRQKPKFSDLRSAFKSGAVCEVVLDARTLDDREGFSLHRVVIVDVNSDTVTFHDPRKIPRPARRESLDLFKRAWLEVVSEPELCIYSNK